jgi:GAF domain-containing protein
VEALLQGVAASYFALALLGALALFARSYLRAPSPDARRRLRVALLGTALGVAPVAAAVLVRNLLPQLALPGERWMPLTLVLIPASFAYAIAVHHIFDFRIALRFSVTYLSVAALIAALYLVAQPLLRRGFPDMAPAQTAVSLAFLAALAALAGPVRPWLQRLTERLMPIEEEAPAAALLDGFQPPAPAGIEQVLESAALALRQGLRLSGCGAVEFAPEGPRWIGWWGDGHGDVPRFTPALHSALDARRGVVSLEDPDTVLLADEDRLALGEVGATLLVPLAAADEVRAALVLGQRLSGRWFSRRERHALHAFARQTSVALENAILHGADRRHGELRREMAAARHIQDHLLPLRPPVFPTLDCAGSTHSCEEVGGDYYDFVERSPRDLVFAVGDCATK